MFKSSLIIVVASRLGLLEEFSNFMAVFIRISAAIMLVFLCHGHLFSGVQVRGLPMLEHGTFTELSPDGRPFPLLQKLKLKKDLGRKYTAAILAFPFPFGIVGLHRIYLGCAPYVPVVYIASLGGVFGLLPLIDCIVILIEKDPEKYANSPKVFMWVNE